MRKHIVGELYNLNDTINQIYKIKTPISRLLYVTKIKEAYSDKQSKETTLHMFKEEVRNYLRQLDRESNLMLIFIGATYAFVAIEVTKCLMSLEYK